MAVIAKAVDTTLSVVQLAILVAIALAVYRFLNNVGDLPDNLRDFIRWLMHGKTSGTSETMFPEEGGGVSGDAKFPSPMVARARTICAARGGPQSGVLEGISNPFVTCKDGSMYDLNSGRVIQDW